MKFLKIILLPAMLFSVLCVDAKGGRKIPVATKPIAQLVVQPQPISSRSVPIVAPRIPQQPVAKPTSYAQALNAIKTKMSSNEILINNRFTKKFIDFVKSLNLSAIETKALLEAGANIHATWTDNNEMNKQTLLFLNNAIQGITQIKPIEPVKQPLATKPIEKFAPVIIPKPVISKEPIESIEKNVATKKNFITNNVIIILDPQGGESEKGGAMTKKAIAALYSKAAPIIMTSDILENIINIKQKIGNNDLQKLRNANPEEITDQAKSMLTSHNVTITSPNELILISHIDLDSKNFNYYFHKSAPLVLLIPKQYINANFVNATSLNSNQQARACGFNPAIVTAITDITNENLIQQLQRQQSIDEEEFTTALTSLFVPQKKDGQLISLEEDTQWIMYLTGHGLPAGTGQPIGKIREELEKFKESFTFWKNVLAQEKDNINAKKWIPILHSNIKENEKKLQGKSSWHNSQLTPEPGRVAGLSIENFLQLMKFFNKNLNMAFLHYSTCFAGGSNQSFVNETLSLFNAHFIVSSEGIDESATLAELIINKKKYPIRLESPLYDEFFRLLRMFITQPKEFVKIKGKAKDPIPAILRTVISKTDKENQPSVRFPSVGAFVALPLSKNTKVLTQTLVKSHEIEKKPIDLRNTDIDMLIVNTPRINVPLNLGNDNNYKHIAIIFPSPKNNIPSYESVHVFKEINFDCPLQTFLYDCIYLNARMYTQTFVINKLTNIWYEQSRLPNTPNAIHNLIIQIKGITGNNISASKEPIIQFTPLTSESIEYGKTGANVQITFELNGAIYQSMFGIKSFENTYDLYKNIEKITFVSRPAQTIDMNSVARTFLTPQEIAKLAKPITLKSIAQFINSKINQQDPSMAMWSEADEQALLKFVKEHVKK